MQAINKQLLNITLSQHIVFIEFARDNYKKALKNFSPEILKNSIILYIKTSFETCIRRNEERFFKKDIDTHIVPLHIMESYYKTDDIEQALFKNKKINLENNNISTEELKLRLDNFFNFYIKNENV